MSIMMALNTECARTTRVKTVFGVSPESWPASPACMTGMLH